MVLLPFKTFPAVMGGQKGSALFYQHLASYYPVYCIGRTENTAPYPDKLEVINIIKKRITRFLDPFLFFQIWKIASEKKVTHLFLDHPYLGFHALLLKWFSGVKLITHSHNIEGIVKKDMKKWWWRLLLLFEKIVHQNSNFNLFKTEEDREYAIQNFNLKPSLTFIVPYGIEQTKKPGDEELMEAAKKIKHIHNIPDNEKVFLFTGSLSYKPNIIAAEVICKEINPVFELKNIPYKILICGGSLPESYYSLRTLSKNIIFTGFVDDIEMYYMGCDAFINPVSTGGGIKTKLIDSLSYCLPVVSTVSATRGIDKEIAGDSHFIVPDDNSNAFAAAMKDVLSVGKKDNPVFFQKFSWKNIIKQVVEKIEQV